MSPEPIRREPGPRDWTPGGGYSDGPASSGTSARGAKTPRAAGAASAIGASAGRPRIGRMRRPRRISRVASRDHGIAALLVGLVAFATAAISWPAGEGGYSVLLSTVGLIAVALGVSTFRAWRIGLARHRGMARTGIALGSVSLISSGILLANGWWGLTIPALPDVTRAAVTSATQWATASGQSEAQSGSPDSVGAPEPGVIGAPDPAVTAPPVFATADEEFARLATELGTLVFLIGQASPDAAPDALYVQPSGSASMDTDGSILAPNNEWVTTGYARGANGTHLVTMTGAQHGTIAYYDSTVGVIERR